MGLRDLGEFEDEESQKELEMLYGRTVKAWEDVESWDDLVIKEEKAIISDLEAGCISTCPHLEKKDNYFYYCKAKAEAMDQEGFYAIREKPVWNSAQYQSKVDHFELQLYCMNEERCDKCINYGEAQRGV
jgi:hypothetical protein